MPCYESIDHSALRLGQPLAWPVYDKDGHLLLAKGYIIETQSQLDKLIQRGMFRDPEDLRAASQGAPIVESRKISPFLQMEEWLERLAAAHQAVIDKRDDAEKRIHSIADHIRKACEQDPDASMAMVHIRALQCSPADQTIFHAVLACLLAKQLAYSEPALKRVIACALTANIALLPYQERLNNSGNKLTDKLREVINKHPNLSVEALKAAGINDRDWLLTIEQHHEAVDGQGYPNGLRGEAICRDAKLISLVERYTAMVTIRAYRPRLSTLEAFKNILQDADRDPGESLYPTFIKMLSTYPPGTFVRLANGETAVIIQRANATSKPQVKAIFNPKGNPYHGAFSRDCNHQDFDILQVAMPDSLPALNLGALWNY